MKKSYILTAIVLFAIAITEGFCSPVLVSVELPTMESKKTWYKLNIPTYELIGNTAIAEVEESQLSLLKQKRYQPSIIDWQPDLNRYKIMPKSNGIARIKGKTIWEGEEAVIIRSETNNHSLLDDKKHLARQMNIKPLGDRFWKNISTVYVPMNAIKYNAFIQSIVDQVNADSITSYIQRLQDFRSRVPLTDSSYAASSWIKQKYEQWGYIAEFDSFYMDSSEWYPLEGFEKNVIGTTLGAFYPDREYIVSGHFDSPAYSIDMLYLTNSPGADDNASGVAATLETARIFKNYAMNPTIRFCAWAVEEISTTGSRHYAAWADSLNADIRGVLNIDMIGFMNTAGLSFEVFHEYSFDQWLADLFIQAGQTYVSSTIFTRVTSFSPSDNQSFEQHGYPGILVIEDAYDINPIKHTSSDSLCYLTQEMYVSATKAAVATLATLTLCPDMVENFQATQTGSDSSLALSWSSSPEPDVDGYWIWWRTQGETYEDSVYITGRTAWSDTLKGLEPYQIYYLIIKASNPYGLSVRAEEINGTPTSFPMDKGILVVDETQNWTTGSFPRDSVQDKYYDSLFVGYNYAQYEYNDTLTRPNLAKLGDHSTIFWHADDYSQPMLNCCLSDLKLYLDHGGKLCIEGWKPSADITGNSIDTAHYYPGSFMYDYMKVSQMNRSLVADSFQTALGKQGYSDISVDPAKVPVTSWGGTMRYIENLTPVSPAEGIYDIDMKNDGSSLDGLNCGVRYLGNDFKTVLLGFPLYFMDKTQAKAAVQKIMDDFGEVNGVSGRPKDNIPALTFKLSQNAPNPFAKSTVISYQLPKAYLVQLNIYNIAGQLVKTFNEGYKPAGGHQINWDDNLLPNGIYFYRLQAGDLVSTKRLLIVR